VISLAFTTGLQLSNAVQESVGWVLIGLAAVGACVYVFFERRTETKEATMTSGDENTNTGGDQNINYGQQHVGINKGTINIVSAQPAVKPEPMIANEETDEGYVSKVRVLIKDGYAAQRIGVKFMGQTIKSGVLMSASGITQNEVQEVQPDVAVFNAGPPVIGNEYVAVVTTEKPDNLSVEVAVQ